MDPSIVEDYRRYTNQNVELSSDNAFISFLQSLPLIFRLESADVSWYEGCPDMLASDWSASLMLASDWLFPPPGLWLPLSCPVTLRKFADTCTRQWLREYFREFLRCSDESLILFCSGLSHSYRDCTKIKSIFQKSNFAFIEESGR